MSLGLVSCRRGGRSLQGRLCTATHGPSASGLSKLLDHPARRPAADCMDEYAAAGLWRYFQYIIATGIDITERKHLEKAILDISAREQRRIGQDLHDGLGQHLTGIAFMAKVHEAKLAEQKKSEADEAAKIVKLVNEAIHKTRELARGLLPVVSDPQGLMSALQLWAAEVEDLFGVSCRFRCERPVLIHDNSMATHLYHIAQEAVNNAIKHGAAQEIVIRLTVEEGRGTLAIKDDGKGIAEIPTGAQGMGLHIMNYRAGMIGGGLEIRRDTPRGTVVTCFFPVKDGE